MVIKGSDYIARPVHADRERWLELQAIIHRVRQTDPHQRYEAAEDKRADLELLQRGGSIKRKVSIGRRWKLARNFLIATILLALGSGAANSAFRALNRSRPLSSEPEELKLYEQAKYLRQNGALNETLQANSNLLAAVRLDPQFVDAYYLLTETY